jgi:hypothetical protein
MWQTWSPLLGDYTNLVQDRTWVEAYVDAVLLSPTLIIPYGRVEAHNEQNTDIRSPMRVNGCLGAMSAISSNPCRRSREGRLTIWG